MTNAPSDMRGFGRSQDRSVFVAYVLQPGAGHTSHVHSCACDLANRIRCRVCKRMVFFRCLAACCGPLLADDVYPREPGSSLMLQYLCEQERAGDDDRLCLAVSGVGGV